ncbi:phage tail protein [Solwaraspora sp. WMMB335]|uniref:phage tail protein n=1 Tax=Solwaraspora sp. WMMB335 TaxID=3404118 RepID=UPI003B9636E8
MRRQAIERLLPGNYQRVAGPGGVLGAMIEVMAGMHEPCEARLDAADDLFHPYRAPAAMVPFLLHWMAADHLLGGVGAVAGNEIPLGRLRNALARAAAAAQWRGTAHGLRTVIEDLAGVSGIRLSEPADQPFHVIVHVPADAADAVALIRRVVEQEKPAATTYEIHIPPILPKTDSTNSAKQTGE